MDHLFIGCQNSERLHKRRGIIFDSFLKHPELFGSGDHSSMSKIVENAIVEALSSKKDLYGLVIGQSQDCRISNTIVDTLRARLVIGKEDEQICCEVILANDGIIY